MVFLGFLDVFGNFGKITTFGKTTSPSKNTFLDGYMYNIGGYVDTNGLVMCNIYGYTMWILMSISHLY